VWVRHTRSRHLFEALNLTREVQPRRLTRAGDTCRAAYEHRSRQKASLDGSYGLDLGRLKELAERCVQHIGKESFFELM
jgi:hypothetical protein